MKLEVSPSVRVKFQIGRIIAKALSHNPKWNRLQESIKMESAIESYTGFFNLDIEQEISKILQPTIVFLSKKLDLSRSYLWDCFDTYNHSDRFGR